MLITLGDLISLPIHERTALRRDAVLSPVLLSAAAVCPHAAAWAGHRRKESVKPGPPSKPLPAQGQGGRKRTPRAALRGCALGDVGVLQ